MSVYVLRTPPFSQQRLSSFFVYTKRKGSNLYGDSKEVLENW